MKINAIGRRGTLTINIPAVFISAGMEYQYVRTQNIRNTYSGDEGRASRRGICLWKAGGSAFLQVKRGTVTGEGKI